MVEVEEHKVDRVVDGFVDLMADEDRRVVPGHGKNAQGKRGHKRTHA